MVSLVSIAVDEISIKIRNGKEFLYCVKNIPSSYEEEYIQFLIDRETLQPVLPVFSTLRNSFIDLKNLHDIEKLIGEDTKYKEIIDAYFFNLHNIPRMQAEKVLLTAFDGNKKKVGELG